MKLCSFEEKKYKCEKPFKWIHSLEWMSLEAWIHALKHWESLCCHRTIQAWRFCSRKGLRSICWIPWNFFVVLSLRKEPSLSKAALFQFKRLTAQWSSALWLRMSSQWASTEAVLATPYWPESMQCHHALLHWGFVSFYAPRSFPSAFYSTQAANSFIFSFIYIYIYFNRR